VIFALSKNGGEQKIAGSVASYIGAAYFFTSSTSFANPAIAVGRMFSNSFAGIAPSSVPAFVIAEIIGGVLAVLLVRFLFPRKAANV
jgi:glycerol uptake facilitator-like aquaporin